MTMSMKAALLSALVFPGAGHALLKKYVFASILAAAALIGIILMVAQMIDTAMQISEKIMTGEVRPDVATIMDMVSAQSAGSEAQGMNVAVLIIVVSWLIGIVDAYRLGRMQDRTRNM